MSSAAQHSVERVQPDRSSIPQSLNFFFAAMFFAANLFQLFVVPLYLLPLDLRWRFAILALAFLNNPLWALLHEAIHNTFHPSPRINLAAGRALSILFGTPFHILRLTHLSHHKFNRSPLERGTELYDPRQSSKLRAGARYYSYIVCGLYFLEVFSAGIFLLPAKWFHRLGRRLGAEGNLQEKWLANKFVDARKVIRADAIVVIVIFSASAYCYRGHWFVFFTMIVLRTFLVSFMDNIYHYNTPINVTVSGHNLWLPRGLSLALLNFNLHRVHHTHPHAPWNQLPVLFARDRDSYDKSMLAAALDQFRGPITMEESLRRVQLRRGSAGDHADASPGLTYG